LLLSVRSRRGNLDGREGPGDLAPHLDAAFYTPEKLRIAVPLFLADASFQPGVVLALAPLGFLLCSDLACLA
jgi:hypothetical protein